MSSLRILGESGTNELFSMKIIENTSSEILVLHFWDEFLKSLIMLEREQRIVIGLSWGSSFDIFYTFLRNHFGEIPVDLRKKIHFVFLDERIVDIESNERNEKQLREKFLDALIEQKLLNESQILSIDTTSSDVRLEYSSRVPKINIGFFGVGPDGHIASLFPSHNLLYSTENSYLEIKDSPKPPSHRITVSPKMILEMNTVFVAFMKGKENAYRNFMDDTLSWEVCPVKFLLEIQKSILLTNIDTY